MALANRLAHALLLGASGNETIYPVNDLAAMLGLEADRLTRIVHDVRAELLSIHAVLLTHADSADWTDQAERVRGQFRAAPHPLWLHSPNAIEAYRLFFDRVASPDEAQSPNLLVLVLENAARFAEAVASCENTGQYAATRPALVILQAGETRIDHPWLVCRRHCLLPAPTRIADIVAVVNELLAPSS